MDSFAQNLHRCRFLLPGGIPRLHVDPRPARVRREPAQGGAQQTVAHPGEVARRDSGNVVRVSRNVSLRYPRVHVCMCACVHVCMCQNYQQECGWVGGCIHVVISSNDVIIDTHYHIKLDM